MNFKHMQLHPVHPAFVFDANKFAIDDDDNEIKSKRGVWTCGAKISAVSLAVANEIVRIYEEHDIPAACRMGIGLLTGVAQQQQSDYLNTLVKAR